MTGVQTCALPIYSKYESLIIGDATPSTRTKWDPGRCVSGKVKGKRDRRNKRVTCGEGSLVFEIDKHLKLLIWNYTIYDIVNHCGLCPVSYVMSTC